MRGWQYIGRPTGRPTGISRCTRRRPRARASRYRGHAQYPHRWTRAVPGWWYPRAYMICLLCVGRRLDGAAVHFIVPHRQGAEMRGRVWQFVVALDSPVIPRPYHAQDATPTTTADHLRAAPGLPCLTEWFSSWPRVAFPTSVTVGPRLGSPPQDRSVDRRPCAQPVWEALGPQRRARPLRKWLDCRRERDCTETAIGAGEPGPSARPITARNTGDRSLSRHGDGQSIL
jgi:hypothetical protein